VKVTVERTPESEAVLNVELEWDELEKASDRAYHKLAQKYNVPGFRRGHAPRSVLERMLGKEAIYQEGLEDLIDESYRKAVRENDLVPLAQPHVHAPPIEIGQPYSFSAHVAILTPVELGDYKSIRVAQPSVEVTDEDVQNVVERIRQDQAMWLPAERPAQIGDRVTVDLKLTVGDRQVSDLHDNEFELAEERPGIYAGMDPQLAGMSEGESKEFTTTIPEDYGNPDLAAKEAQYAVTVKAVKYRELPEIDDELAKSVGDFENVEEMTQAVREQLQSQKESEGRRELREQVIKEAVDQAKVDIHPVLVSDEVDVMMRETQRMLEQSRISLEQYLEMTNKKEDEYRQELEPEARERVKRDLVLSAVADAENIQVSEQEMERWLEALASLGGKPMRLRQLTAGQRANVESRLRRDEATNRLIEIAAQDQPATAASDESAAVGNAIEAAQVGVALEAGSEEDAAAAVETKPETPVTEAVEAAPEVPESQA
jgi:trigger factor